jgi:peptidoglycan/LPS O-acetylase OafA/YrhL
VGALRLLLALSVVAAHTSAIRWLPLPTGISAVRIFFAISGFYMALVLNEKYVGPGSYRIFIANRFTRIYPVYFVVAGMTLILALLLPTQVKLFDPQRLAELGMQAKIFIFGANLTIFGLDSFDFLAIDHGSLEVIRNGASYPDYADHMRLVPQAWSLGPELLFYLMAPFIVRDPRRIYALALVSIAARLIVWNLGYVSYPWSFEFFPSELVFFLMGAALYHVRRTEIYQHWAPALIPSAVFAAALGIFNFNDLPGVLSYSLIIGSIPLLFELTQRNPLDRFVGEFSFPVYMIHFFLIYGARAVAPDLAASGRFSSICAAASLVMSVIIYRGVVQPIDRWRDRRTEVALQAGLVPVDPSKLFGKPQAETPA